MKRYYEMRSESNDLPTAIRNRLLMTKQDLLLDICERRESILSALSNSSRHTTRYYSVMKKLLDLFYERVEKTILPKQLEDWWFYSYDVSYRGIHLYLNHHKAVYLNEEKTESGFEELDQVFKLLEIPAIMLTVDEYAKLYQVEQVTVRQWIRRCKLRTVLKEGKEWRISVLTDVPGRGFEPARYRWFKELSDLPPEFEYLNTYKEATIDKISNNNYKVVFSEAKTFGNIKQTFEITNEEREILESYLIGNNDVTYSSDTQSFKWKIEKGVEAQGKEETK